MTSASHPGYDVIVTYSTDLWELRCSLNDYFWINVICAGKLINLSLSGVPERQEQKVERSVNQAASPGAPSTPSPKYGPHQDRQEVTTGHYTSRVTVRSRACVGAASDVSRPPVASPTSRDATRGCGAGNNNNQLDSLCSQWSPLGQVKGTDI